MEINIESIKKKVDNCSIILNGQAIPMLLLKVQLSEIRMSLVKINILIPINHQRLLIKD